MRSLIASALAGLLLACPTTKVENYPCPEGMICIPGDADRPEGDSDGGGVQCGMACDAIADCAGEVNGLCVTVELLEALGAPVEGIEVPNGMCSAYPCDSKTPGIPLCNPLSIEGEDDGCCPRGATDATDADCRSDCGDGVCSGCACDVNRECTDGCACDPECECACDVDAGCTDGCECDPACFEHCDNCATDCGPCCNPGGVCVNVEQFGGGADALCVKYCTHLAECRWDEGYSCLFPWIEDDPTQGVCLPDAIIAQTYCPEEPCE